MTAKEIETEGRQAMTQAVKEPTPKQDTGVSQLTVDRVKFLTEQLKTALPQVQELEQVTKQLEDEISNELMQLALSMKLGKNIDRDAIEAFKKRPFTFTPYVGDRGERREGWYYLIIPRFVDMQIGWLEKQDLSYNVFVVNRWLDWLGQIPELIKKQLGIKPPPHLDYADGIITGEASAVDAFARKYPGLIRSRRGNRLVTRPKRYFEVLASLIKEGVKPFHEQPVPKEILTERKCDYKMRPHQEDAWRSFLQYSNMGLFWPASVGKSVFGVWLPTRIKPPILVTVPTILLKETWEERIKLHTDLKLGEEIEVLVYWTAIKKYGDGHKIFNLKIADECHHLPANDLSRLVTIPAVTSLGLTASPQREDKREEFIYAFTGQPFGLSWDYFRKLNLIRNPVCNVWIVKSVETKVKYIGELSKGKRTLIFCDSIELGTMVSKRYDIPHVHGTTKRDRLKTIQDAPLVVVSRVGDEGISLPEVEQIIEISWLGKSRRQQVQRFTRLLHSRIGKAREEEESVISDLTEKDRKEIAEMAEEEARLREPSYHILMTLEEYVRDRQRLFSVMDKGFKVEIHREGVSERQFTRTQEAAAPMRTPKRIRVSVQAPSETQKSTSGTEGSVQSSAMFASLPPGMQKLILSRNEPEQKLIIHLYSRDGEWQPTNMLYLALNYTSRSNMTSIDFADLERRRIIERKRGFVRTNFRGFKE